jgi:malyl-CoA/(S)-citramalyl-CoA lyase
MRNPRDFGKPLAIGAPTPLLELPVKPSRVIHFFDPSNPNMAAKLPELALETDVLLGNLEDAIPADGRSQFPLAAVPPRPAPRPSSRLPH